MKKFWTTAFSLFLGFWAFAQEPKLLEIVSDLGDQFERFVPEKDIEQLMNLYGEEIKYLPENGNLLIGKSAVRKHWEKTLSYDIVDFKMTSKTAEGSKKLIYETGLGQSKLRSNGKEIIVKFKFVNIWKKERDGYKLIVDTYNMAPKSEGT